MENFNPSSLTSSQLRPYSYGIVAQNKELKSNIIDVTPIEDLNMVEGEITGNVKELKASSKNANGASKSSSVRSKVTIKAEWMPMGTSNRMTSPDVRRGESVMLYQFGDSDKYYWTTMKNDMKLRRLETAVFAFSATTKESDKVDAGNSYFMEVSTHTKTMTLHTSKANGEFCQYDVQIDAGNGKLVIMDDIGNVIKLDSAAGQVFVKNSSDSVIDVSKGDITAKSSGKIDLESPSINLKGSSGVNITSGGSSFSVSQSGMSGKGNMNYDGKMNVTSVETDSIVSGNYGDK